MTRPRFGLLTCKDLRLKDHGLSADPEHNIGARIGEGLLDVDLHGCFIGDGHIQVLQKRVERISAHLVSTSRIKQPREAPAQHNLLELKTKRGQ